LNPMPNGTGCGIASVAIYLKKLSCEFRDTFLTLPPKLAVLVPGHKCYCGDLLEGQLHINERKFTAEFSGKFPYIIKTALFNPLHRMPIPEGLLRP